MLGMEGIAVPLGLILTLVSTLLCIVYGVKNWNAGVITEEELEQERLWHQEDTKAKESL